MKDNHDGTVDFHAHVSCSSGTYVRVLAEDFGKRLNVGAHLAELRRTRVGAFLISNAITLEKLEARFIEEALGTILVQPGTALSHLPFVHLNSEDARRARHGMEVGVAEAEWPDGTSVRICDEHGYLLAIGDYAAQTRRLHPRVVIAPSE
jgi:tRNA pseudouridine55 synthase